MKGVILGILLHDYKSQLKVNDLVCIDDQFFNLDKIDPRLMREEGQADNPNMFCITEPISGELMNYRRDELSKASSGIFDYDKYYNNNQKVMLGNINIDDLRNMKAKVALEWEVPTDKIDTVKIVDILEQCFDGEVITKEFKSPYSDDNTPPTKVKYFKLTTGNK